MTEASPRTDSPSRTALPAGGLRIPSKPGGTELSSLPLSAVLFVTTFAGLVGAAVLWLLTRRGPSGVRIWAILAVVFGALSALPAFSIDTSTARQLGLVLFHLLATVVVIAVARQQLARLTREPA